MCGIVGFIDFTNRSTDHNLIQMISTLNHRGPDGSGFNHLNTSSAQVGLAHSRLSIIDLSTAAAQPMHFDGLYLSFNGEVYNFIEIRNRLIHLGYSKE